MGNKEEERWIGSGTERTNLILLEPRFEYFMFHLFTDKLTYNKTF